MIDEVFPNIPILEDGQALSAGVLNAYTKAATALLGESHRTYQADMASGYLAYTSWREVWRGWLFLDDERLYCYLLVSLEGGATSYEIALDIKDDNGVFTQIWYYSGSSSVLLFGNIWVPSSFSTNVLRSARFVAKCSPTGHVAVTVRYLGTERYITPRTWPTFSNGNVLYASSLSALRDNMNTIRGRIATATGLGWTSDTSNIIVSNGSWVNVRRPFFWKYRPDKIVVGFIVIPYVSSWQWRVQVTVLPPASGTTTTTVYTSPTYGYASNWVGYEEEIDLSSLGISRGKLVSAQIQVYSSSSGEIHMRRPYIFRMSSGTPAGGWPSLPTWSHGDTNIGATELSKIVTAGQMLDAGGSEEVTHESRAVYEDDGTYLWGVPVYIGLYRRRWLAYRPIAGKTSRLRFGETLVRDETFSLPQEDEHWHNFDLSSCKHLPPGRIYIVEGVYAAMEADEPLEEAPNQV